MNTLHNIDLWIGAHQLVPWLIIGVLVVLLFLMGVGALYWECNWKGSD